MEILYILGFLIFGVFVGFVSGFFGIGGGSIVVPLMMAFGFDIKAAVGISIMQMVFSSIFGSFINYKAGKLKINEGIIVGFGGLFGASLSGAIVKQIPSIFLEVGLATTLFISIAKFFITQTASKKELNSKILLFILGFLIGIFAISMGVGGAIFLTPILVGFMGYDIKKAVSMGLFFVIFSSVSGFISMSLNGLVDYKNGFLLGVGSLLGVYFGVKLSHKIDKNLQKRLLLCMYIILFLLTMKKIIFG